MALKHSANLAVSPFAQDEPERGAPGCRFDSPNLRPGRPWVTNRHTPRKTLGQASGQIAADLDLILAFVTEAGMHKLIREIPIVGQQHQSFRH
jgi:hypothetical protein